MGFTDIRHAIRLLGRSPIFTVTSIASLAIGIGASAAIYSLSDALLFEPTAGLRNAGEVVDIGRANEGSGFDNMSHPAYQYLHDHTQTLSLMSAVDFGGGPMSLGDNGASERVFGTLVSGEFFDVLGTRPALGRFFRKDEDLVPGERPVVVLTHAFWMRRFHGDPDILQKPLRLNNHEFAVVGVAEPGFSGSSLVGTDLWVPMSMVAIVKGRADSSMLDEPGGVWHVAIGRLKPAVPMAQAQAELNTLMDAFKASEPRANQRHTIALVKTSRIPGPMRLPFLAFIGFLFALTGALVAIACSNVAGMLLARAAARRREMATRLAVGASRGQLIAQLLTETIVLFLAAGIVALPITLGLIAGLEGFLPTLPVMINLDLSLNPRVIAFSLGTALLTAIVFGLAPARHALGGDLAPMLHGANATADRRRFRLRNTLVVAQVALSLMLVVTAFLFLRTLQAAAHTDPGFQTANIEIASVDVSLSGYREQAAVALAQRFQERLRGVSGVSSVAVSRMVPLQGSGFGLGRLRVPGLQQGPDRRDTVDADWNIVSPEYFETIGMRMVEGRAFTAADRDAAPMVAVVNETFAREAWPGRLAIGQRVMQETRGDEERALEIVGVVRDSKYRYISETPAPFIYVPLAQQPTSDMTFFIKHAPGRPIAQDVRAAVAQVESSVPIVVMQSLDEATAIGLVPQRLAALIAGSVGSIGIFLAALGLYGLMAFLVAQRTREIAIRMALGASEHDMRAMVLKQAARLGAGGAAIGLVLAGAIGTLAESLLVGVPPIDPVSFGGTAVLFTVVLGVACWTPANRAATTDPATALRAE
ncbi:MAG: ABC transporter permease [Vicinamibacterales bacterium]